MYKVNVVVQEKKWRQQVPNINKILNKNFEIVFSNLKNFKNKNLEVTILLTNTKNMKLLNKKFRNIFKDTDVLSFPNYKKKFFLQKKLVKNLYLGDLALSFEYIKKQPMNFLDYLHKIYVHGCLHLIGYEHNNDANYKIMNALEKKILNKI
jgi:probable rRNA maturation factor